VEPQSTTEGKKGLLQNDRLVVCGMLVVYGVCILGAIGAAFWWLNRRNQVISASATATAAAAATEQANAAVTAAAHATDQAQYEFIERFDSNKFLWTTGSENNEYYNGNREINDGSYVWDVRETKETFIHWSYFQRNNYIRDFDVYVDTKILDANPGDACSGFLFRVSTRGWDDGGYYFVLCSDSYAAISYHTEKDGWEDMATVPYFDYAKGTWNRLEIIARGAHFQFFINGRQVYEMDDDRLEAGSVALVVELNENVPATILFDNFGLQRR